MAVDDCFAKLRIFLKKLKKWIVINLDLEPLLFYVYDCAVKVWRRFNQDDAGIGQCHQSGANPCVGVFLQRWLNVCFKERKIETHLNPMNNEMVFVRPCG